MNKFIESCIESSQEKLTENGAFAYNTSGDKILDFFSTAGALRPRTEEDIIRKFELAYLANREIALRMLFIRAMFVAVWESVELLESFLIGLAIVIHRM